MWGEKTWSEMSVVENECEFKRMWVEKNVE